MNRFEKYGFVKDEDKIQLKKVFNEKKIKKIHIDVFCYDTYMLLSRIVESNASAIVDDDRFHISNNDGVSIVNIPFDYINECMVLQKPKGSIEASCRQFVFKVRNIFYKILVVA